MKPFIAKASLIVLSVSLIIMIGVNGYIMFVAYKLESCGSIFEKFSVVVKYHLLHNMNVIMWSTLLTIILLGLMLFYVVKEFIIKCKKTVYTLND